MVATATATATATVITATRASAKGEEGVSATSESMVWCSNIIPKVIMAGQFLAPIRCQRGVSHLLSNLRSHQKRNAHDSILAGT
jgi:hypothetical protein